MRLQRLLRVCALFCLSAALCSVLLSCKKSDGEDSQTVYYTVTFDSNGGTEVTSKRILSGDCVPEPETPEKEGYIFIGWMNGTVQWNFDKHTVSSDLTLQAYWVTAESMFAYEVSDNTEHATATITKLKKSASDIPIPSVIGGFSVTAVGDDVFSSESIGTISSVRIPKTVTTVGKRAFDGLSNVAITFEEGCALTSVGEEAFRGCARLTDVPLGDGCTQIEAWSFADCTSLKTVLLPESVLTVCENAFSGCSSLRYIVFHSSVTAVEDSAFEDCTKLKNLFFYGSAEQLNRFFQTCVGKMNTPLLGATAYLYSETQPTVWGEYGFWYQTENQEIKIWS